MDQAEAVFWRVLFIASLAVGIALALALVLALLTAPHLDRRSGGPATRTTAGSQHGPVWPPMVLGEVCRRLMADDGWLARPARRT